MIRHNFHSSRRRRGIALVAVLAVIVLLTLLVVTFLIRAQLARNSAASYRATTGTRLLSDTVVNLVEAEINDATTYGTSSGAGGTGPYTWASQPGAIRVYDSSGNAPSVGGTGFQKLYRLYSAPSLTTSNINDILNTDTTPTASTTDIGGTVKTTGSNPEIDANWASLPAQWVDLNAPVTVTDPASATAFTVYPILDNRNPNNLNQCLQLPGFYVNTLTATGPPYPAATFTASTGTGPTTLNPPIMPVQWLYVLQNGQVISPSSVSGNTLSFSGSSTVPTASNPIVGRIAYWTDDDTCKININTAGGSVSFRSDANGLNILVGDGMSSTTKVFFSSIANASTGNAYAPASWDTPRYGGSWEDARLFGADQPIQGEYQRYPGHPATTILYYVLRALGVNMPEISNSGTGTAYQKSITSSIGSSTQSGGSLPWLFTSSLYGMLPRYNDNAGSQGGIGDTTHTNPPNSITPNRSRLYTSLGELLYATNATSATPPVRTQNGTMNGSTTPIAPFLTRQQIESGKFFLTAHSRAPETTLFGTPRVCMWPIPDTTQTPTKGSGTQGSPMAETTFDKLIAFCSTANTGTGGNPAAYYFQRYDSMSPSNDWINEPRNQSVYSYLQALTGSNIPGYGTSAGPNSFVGKYSGTVFTQSPTIASERDQILTEILDYIRCTNLNDHSWNTAQGNPLPTGKTTYATKGEVIPLQVTQNGNTTAGLGRLLTLSEIGLHIICTADGTNNLGALNASNANAGWPGASAISGSSVSYVAPQTVTIGAFTGTVSPVIGSANDPAYASNLPVAQYLRDFNNNVVDIFGNSTASGTTPNTPFPANQTLTTTGAYGGTLAALPVGSRQLQAMLIFEPASPMNGYDQIVYQGGQGPDVNILVSGSHNIPIAGQNPFPSGTPNASGAGSNGDGYLNGTGTTDVGWVNHGDTDQGGIFGIRFPMILFQNPSQNTSSSSRYNGWSGIGPLTQTGAFTDTTGTNTASQWTHYSGGQPYRFVSNPFTVTGTSISLGGTGSGQSFTVSLTMPVSNGAAYKQVPYQTYTVGFPTVTVPAPTLCAYGFSCRYTSSNNNTYTTHAPDWWGFDNRIGWANEGQYFYSTFSDSTHQAIGLGSIIRGDLAPPTGGWGSGTAWKWNDTSTLTIDPIYTDTTSYGDVVRTVVPKDCDYRSTMARVSSQSGPPFAATINAQPGTASSDFSTPPQYSTATLPMTDMFMEPGNSVGTTGSDCSGQLANLYGSTPTLYMAPKIPSTLSPSALTFTTGSPTTPDPKTSWDWDSGTFGRQDGAYSNKPDEGSTYVGGSVIPYFNAGNQGTITSYFTANRLSASPVAFGSLPTGVAEQIPWRTLLFRPQMTQAQNPSALRTAVSSPPGPEDELLLDNFWMPVVQPYAISEPFSTAGKINMNYQILPFTYITRSTGVQAVLGSELVARVSATNVTAKSNSSVAYEGGTANNITEGLSQSSLYGGVTGAITSGNVIPARLPLNLNDTCGTLRQFRAKFMTGDIFRSAAEICDIYLVPRDSTNTGYYYDWYNSSDLGDNQYADFKNADSWYGTRGDFALVGDNVREKPYGDIYPRLTTKSNTYTVYYRVQTLKNPPGADPAKWTEGQGVMTGEYRGSTAIERYLDPSNVNIPDYTQSSNNPAVDPSQKGLDSYYQWRTVSNTAFAP